MGQPRQVSCPRAVLLLSGRLQSKEQGTWLALRYGGGADHPAPSDIANTYSVFCPRLAFLQYLVFRTRIQLRGARKVIKIKGHLITVSGTATDSFFFLIFDFFFQQGTGFRLVISSSKHFSVKCLLTHLFVSHLIPVSSGG